MNKYKIYISLILIFVLVIIPLNHKYCYTSTTNPKADFLWNKPKANQQVSSDQSKVASNFIKNYEKNYKELKNLVGPLSQKQSEIVTKYENAKKYLENFLWQKPEDNQQVSGDQSEIASDFINNYEEEYKRIKSIYGPLTGEDSEIITKYENAEKYLDIYKKQPEKNKKNQYKTNISTDITDENFINQFSLDDKNNNNGPIEPILNLIQYVTNIVLGIIQVFSGFLMVVTIAYTGFKMILSTDANNNGGLAANLGFDDLGNSSPAGKKRLQEFMQHLMIGTVITFTSTTIARAIFNILTKV